MRRLCLLLGLIVGSILFAPQPAFADCSYEERTTFFEGFAQVDLVLTCSQDDDRSAQSVGDAPTLPPRESDLDTVCVREAIEQNVDVFEFCDIPPDEVEPANVTPDLVAAAMRRVRVPSAEVVVQPPGGTTLVNFETNFYTETEAFTHGLSLLGQRVDLRLTPASYTWRFGDGAVQRSESPGAAYPQLDVTHVYGAKQTARPSVDTTWTATYRLNDGPSRPVPGSVTIPGAPVSLEVITARPRLVG